MNSLSLKKKRIGISVLGVVVLAIISIMLVVPAKAVEKTLSNGSVVYKYVKNTQELVDYIDANGVYSSQDTITTSWSGVGDAHMVKISEPGTLIIIPLCKNNNIDVNVYSNFSLTAKLGAVGSRESSWQSVNTFKVKKGTYYYQGSRWNGYNPITYTTYVGFIPDSGKMKVISKLPAVSDASIKTVKYHSLTNTDFASLINANVAYSSQDTITTDWSGYSPVHKFTIKTAGWLYVYPLGPNNNVDWKLYTNADLTSCIMTTNTRETITDKPGKVYLDPGTYYYRGTRWNGYNPFTYTTYMGFMPSSKRISVKSIKLSSNATYANVTFNYNKAYLGNFINGTVRVISGKVSAANVYDDTTWVTKDRRNAIQSPTIKITKNGTYTARISSGKDDQYCMVTFTVKGIKPLPKQTTVSYNKRTSSTKALIKFKKLSSVKGYEIVVSSSSKFTKKYTKTYTTTKTSYTISKLKKGTAYYVKVRGYHVVNGKKVYGTYSKVIKIAKK